MLYVIIVSILVLWLLNRCSFSLLFLLFDDFLLSCFTFRIIAEFRHARALSRLYFLIILRVYFLLLLIWWSFVWDYRSFSNRTFVWLILSPLRNAGANTTLNWLDDIEETRLDSIVAQNDIFETFTTSSKLLLLVLFSRCPNWFCDTGILLLAQILLCICINSYTIELLRGIPIVYSCATFRLS